MDLINKITEKKELFPRNNKNTAIYIKIEDTKNCFEKVSDMDTREYIKELSKEKLDIDKKNIEFVRALGNEDSKKWSIKN